MNKSLKSLIIGVLSLSPIPFAFAAGGTDFILKDLKGHVMIDNGTSFTLAHEGISLDPGTKLVVPAGGAGRLVFNSCVLRLNPGTVATVPSNGLCNLVERPYLNVASVGAPASTSVVAVTKLTAWIIPAATVTAAAAVVASNNTNRQAPAASAF